MLGFLKSLVGAAAKTPVPLEVQFQNLAACGITLRPGVTREDLLQSVAEEDLVNEPYTLLLMTMGGETEQEPFTVFSDSIWHFDFEAIEDHGAYKMIALRMKALAGADLPLEDIKDCVDLESVEAWVSFRLDGKEYKWDAKIDNDWADPAIFSQFAALLKTRTQQRIYIKADLGQDCMIGCATPAQMASLNALLSADMHFVPLK